MLPTIKSPTKFYIIVGLCILDALLTLVFLAYDLADEGNPLMQYLIDIDLWIFVLVKIIWQSLCAWVIAITNSSWREWALNLVGVLYLGVIIYMIGGMSLSALGFFG